jgi:hypothetical protein
VTSIVTDQVKGSMGAIAEVRTDCGHVFCAWHRRQNIIKQCGGSSSRVPYSTLWVYNRLTECMSVDHFDKLCKRYFPLMILKDLQYLNKVNDASHYTVKRCKQGAFMFHRTTSQGSEVMNAANIEVRHKVAVCPINACILLMNTESRRYERQKKKCMGANKQSHSTWGQGVQGSLGLNRQNIMPFWWTRTQWQEQIPQEVRAQFYTNMEVIRANYEADDSMRYCPSWSTPNKAGRPSKGKRKLSALEKSQGKKKNPKPLTRFCQICRGFSHRTINCWHQEKWMTERAAIEEAIILSADPVPIWPGFQTQGSKEDVDEEGSEEDVDKDKEFDEINEETIVSAGGGEGESQEQEEGTAD